MPQLCQSTTPGHNAQHQGFTDIVLHLRVSRVLTRVAEGIESRYQLSGLTHNTSETAITYCHKYGLVPVLSTFTSFFRLANFTHKSGRMYCLHMQVLVN